MKRVLAILAIIMTVLTFPAYSEEATYTSFYTTPWEQETLRGNLDSVYVDGHFYSTDIKFDDMEEIDLYYFTVDGQTVLEFDTDTPPRGIARIGSTVYVALVDGIYKYTDGAMKKIAKFGNGAYIYGMVSNNKDLYVFTSSNRTKPWRMFGYDASFFKITPSGSISAIKGSAFFEYYTYGIAVNADGDRLAYVPYAGSDSQPGTHIKRMDGTEYIQRSQDAIDFDGDAWPDNVLYYNNCLIVNDNNTLYMYDENNKRRQVLSSNVDVGKIKKWNIGTDGNVYGWTSINYEDYTFKYVVPDKIKSTVTYKKKK